MSAVTGAGSLIRNVRRFCAHPVNESQDKQPEATRNMRTDAATPMLICALLCLAVSSVAVTGCVSDEERQHRRELKARADQTTGPNSTCPVHHIAMQTKTVPIAYGLLMSTPPEPSLELREQR